MQYRRGVPPVVNEEISTRILTHAIEAIGPDVLCDTRQSGGGEDFSWYLEEVPGAMARLGVWSGRGPQLDLHQPTFDLDERGDGGRRAVPGQHRRPGRRSSGSASLRRATVSVHRHAAVRVHFGVCRSVR